MWKGCTIITSLHKLSPEQNYNYNYNYNLHQRHLTKHVHQLPKSKQLETSPRPTRLRYGDAVHTRSPPRHVAILLLPRINTCFSATSFTNLHVMDDVCLLTGGAEDWHAAFAS